MVGEERRRHSPYRPSIDPIDRTERPTILVTAHTRPNLPIRRNKAPTRRGGIVDKFDSSTFGDEVHFVGDTPAQFGTVSSFLLKLSYLSGENYERRKLG